MKRWTFGAGQTDRQERDEILAAVAAGQSEAYLRGQAYSRMIEWEGSSPPCPPRQ